MGDAAAIGHAVEQRQPALIGSQHVLAKAQEGSCTSCGGVAVAMRLMKAWAWASFTSGITLTLARQPQRLLLQPIKLVQFWVSLAEKLFTRGEASSGAVIFFAWFHIETSYMAFHVAVWADERNSAPCAHWTWSGCVMALSRILGAHLPKRQKQPLVHV
jgi:hypothetical protein